MGGRETRKGLNEALFREVNERIADLTEKRHGERLEIVCECSNGLCTAPIEVSVAEYEQARRLATTFIVLAGHEDASVEHVISQRADHALVEKVGDAARAAASVDTH